MPGRPGVWEQARGCGNRPELKFVTLRHPTEIPMPIHDQTFIDTMIPIQPVARLGIKITKIEKVTASNTACSL